MRVAVIPARGGSRRIPMKNIRPFHGKPIIAYSIETARAAELFDLVVVSTRNEEIAQVAERYGAVVHWRSQEASRDEVGTQEVMREALETPRLTPFHEACCIYATAPLMTPKDLQEAHRAWAADLSQTRFHSLWWVYTTGWFYFGSRESFVLSRPLHRNAFGIEPVERWIDINTEEDFLRAEQMYAALHGLKTHG